MRSPDFSEFVTVLAPNEQYTTPEGRKINALSLYQSRNNVITLSKILEETFGYTRYQVHFKPFLRETLFIMSEFNQLPDNEKGEVKQITPIIVSGSQRYYLLPKDQERPMKELLKKNASRLEPYLPFRVTKDEMEQLKVKDQEVKDKVRIRMVRLGLIISPNIPKKDALINVINIINHPSTWKVLLKSEPPVSTKSDFQRYFTTAIHRRSLNYHRDQETQKRIQEELKAGFPLLKGSSLRSFFHEYPPGSEEAERLLKSLSDKQREAFIARYLNNGLAKDHRVLPILAKSELERIIKLPQQEWPKPDMTEAAKQLIKNEYRFFINFFEHLPNRLQEYVVLRFEEGLENQEIAGRLETTEGAIKALGVRFCVQLVSRAIDIGVLREDDIDWGKYFYRGPGHRHDEVRLYAENFLTTKDVSLKLKMHRTSVEKWIRQGILPANMENGVWLIPQEALENFQPPKQGRPSIKKPS